MTRVLSGGVLVLLAVAVVWFAPAPLFLVVAEILLLIAFTEYATLSKASGLNLPRVAAGAGAVLTTAAFPAALELMLITVVVTLAALTMAAWRGETDALARVAAGVFPSLYLGIPIGAMVSVRQARGREALFLLMLTVMVSDTAQYYTGRLAGRTPLAPAISPKKTLEGALGGFVVGGLVLTIVGTWWLPEVPILFRALLGLAVVALGIAGDLFESMLKRSAGVKDSSGLIPGHGGVLDRIDALLFAAPVYYVVLKYV